VKNKDSGLISFVGTIKETWEQIGPDKWFSPDFQNFINTEIIGAKLQT
jgi:hypothetical protein